MSVPRGAGLRAWFRDLNAVERTTAHHPDASDEAGSSLILALVFLIVTGLALTALASWATNDLNVVAKFRAPELLQAAANSATEVAMQSQRYTVTPTSLSSNGATPATPATCSNVPINEGTAAYTMTVWCYTLLNLNSSKTRTVTFTTCQSGTAWSTCQTSYLVQAQVIFDDYPYPIGAPLSSYCVVNCGTAQQVNSWVVEPQD
jgi:hypothetical protein